MMLIMISYSISKSQDSDVQSWNCFKVNWNALPSTMFRSDFLYRSRISSGPSWRDFAFRPSFEYYPNGYLTLSSGLYYYLTKQSDNINTQELRPMFGVSWNITIPEKRFYLNVGARYEYRFYFGENDKKDISRLRFDTRLIVSITQRNYSQDKNLYAIIKPEVFMNFEKNSIQERYKSRFRQEVGLGYRFNYPWRLEVSYIYQASRNSISSESPDSYSNIISTILKYNIAHKRE